MATDASRLTAWQTTTLLRERPDDPGLRARALARDPVRAVRHTAARAKAAAPSARPSIPGLTLTSPRATQPRAPNLTDHHRREKTDTTALERLAFEMAAQAQSDPRVVVSPRFMSVMRRADDGADARVEARDPMGAPRGVSLMFNERRTPAAERQREWRMDPERLATKSKMFARDRIPHPRPLERRRDGGNHGRRLVHRVVRRRTPSTAATCCWTRAANRSGASASASSGCASGRTAMRQRTHGNQSGSSDDSSGLPVRVKSESGAPSGRSTVSASGTTGTPSAKTPRSESEERAVAVRLPFGKRDKRRRLPLQASSSARVRRFSSAVAALPAVNTAVAMRPRRREHLPLRAASDQRAAEHRAGFRHRHTERGAVEEAGVVCDDDAEAAAAARRRPQPFGLVDGDAQTEERRHDPPARDARDRWRHAGRRRADDEQQ